MMNESGSVKTEVKVKQKKTGKTTLNIPLSKNSIDVIKKHLVDKDQEIAATDRGESFMSKALATSGFFKGASKK